MSKLSFFVVSVLLSFVFLGCAITDPLNSGDDSGGQKVDVPSWSDDAQEKWDERNSDCPDCGRQFPAQIMLNLKDAYGIVTLTSEMVQGESVADDVDSALTVGNVLALKESAVPSQFKSFSAVEIGDTLKGVPLLIDGLNEFLSDNEKGIMMTPPPLPPVRVIALSPCGDVYVLFDWPFFYRSDCPNDVDPWSSDSECTCNLFVSEKQKDELLVTDPTEGIASAVAAFKELGDAEDEDSLNNKVWDMLQTGKLSNMKCVDPTHVVPAWDTRAGIIQFDDSCNAYFPAHVAHSWKDVYYRYTPEVELISATKSDDSANVTSTELEEIINANICYHDAKVFPGGGIIYQGTSGYNGKCDGTSFVRYINTKGELVEMVRNWWDVKVVQSVGEICKDAGIDDDEALIYYGPSSDTSGTQSWDTACLYCFGPNIDSTKATATDPAPRVEAVVNCTNNFWNKFNDPAISHKDRLASCIDEGVYLGGGNVDGIIQDEIGGLYLYGNIKKKGEGKFKCNIRVEGAHCNDLYPDKTQSNCSAGNWTTEVQEYYDKDSEVCQRIIDYNELHSSTSSIYIMNNSWCNAPYTSGDSWARDYKALVEIGSKKAITMISSEDEEVIKAWLPKVLNSDKDTVERLFYSSYKMGVYYFKEVDLLTLTTKDVHSGVEIYNIAPSPTNVDEILFSGLEFSSNNYVIGDINVDATGLAYGTVDAKEDATGDVKDIQIINYKK